ncbi:ribonuclease E/G [Paracoccus endophyticus]|uniref:ribonuclease E/G n=1 Tax=Paracoccus endophyticus TaxID=2233774 RepID=UPI001F0C90F7|nr:ribonuclease E/G [Paracoccus endophyticus]
MLMKKMLIDATHAEETRIVVVDGTKVEEFDFETLNKRQLAGNIYLAKVTRVEPSLQAAFIDYGGNRHGFLAFAEIHPDYYQIPAADRRALIEEERAAAEAAEAEETARDKRGPRSRGPRGERAERASGGDAVTRSDDVPGMQIADLSGEDASEEDAALESGFAAAGGDMVDPTVAGQGGDADRPEPAPQDAPEADGEAEPSSPADRDDEIESVAEEDVAEEIRPSKKPRARRYKIQEVIKVRQIMLVQVVKEERGNKGAALTTYLSLAGRYCVLMPNTARGGGISRKITNAVDRKKLKDIASELEVPQGAGLIIRTAGSQRTRTEIKRDYEYLMRLWEQIREVTFRSIAPAPIYEEGDLIKRTIRDLYSKDIDEVLVEGERGYRTAKDFMTMIMPSHARNVKRYTDPMPLFARHQVEGYLAGMFNPTVQLKSGGYIVIGVTEALVAIDVNSGRATKEGSIEDTAFKTNCEAADEIARQLRLRDLAGLIVIDFIDMDERKNNAAVEKRFKERLKTDRARIQVGRISGFGLMEMSRQRLRPGMLESTTQPCAHCHGTGLIRSDDSMALTILRAIEEEGTRKRSREVLVKAPIAVANFIMNAKREHIGMIEARYGMAVRVEADPALISPDYALEKFRTATRNVPEAGTSAVLSVDPGLMAQIDDDEDLVDEPEEEEPEAEAAARDERPARAEGARSEAADADADENGDGRSRRRRRRRKRGGRGDEGSDSGDEVLSADRDQPGEDAVSDAAGVAASDAAAATDEAAEVQPATEGQPATGDRPRRTRSRTRTRKPRAETVAAADAGDDTAAGAAHADAGADRADEAGQDLAGKSAGDDGSSPDVAPADDSPDGDAPWPSDAPATTDASGTTETAPVSQAEAPATDMEPPASDRAGHEDVPPVSQPEAPPADMTPPEGAGAGQPAPVSQPEAPAADMEPPAQNDAEAEPSAPVSQPEAPAGDMTPPADAGAEPSAPATQPEAAEAEAAADQAEAPKRRGWWSFGG